MRGRQTVPAPHRSTHCGDMLCCAMRRAFLQSRFLLLGQLHLPDASFDGRADVGHLVVLIHGFHLQSVVLAQSLRARTDCCTYGGADRPTKLPNDRCNSPITPRAIPA